MTRIAASLEDVRALYAQLATASAREAGRGINAAFLERLEQAFEGVPREAFCGEGPWTIPTVAGRVVTPSADPVYLYQNVLVALDLDKGINNGEPFLHARQIGALLPMPGEALVHVGAGTGYYSAILSLLVGQDGQVDAYEIDSDLAERAEMNLTPYENVSVLAGNGAGEISEADVIYVSASAPCPPLGWLNALNEGGRLLFPWRAGPRASVALRIARKADGFDARAVMPAFYIELEGMAEMGEPSRTPSANEVWQVRSLWLNAEREPDDTAVAIYDDVWFSTEGIGDRG